MSRIRIPLILAILAMGLSLVACGQAPVEAGEEVAVTVEAIDGSELHRITLSAKAAERLAIETALVEEAIVDGQRRTVVPYGAVLWDAQGNGWTYVSPEERVYIRAPIRLDHIDRDRAVLAEGPDVGTSVVTVGVSELWGSETGVGGGH